MLKEKDKTKVIKIFKDVEKDVKIVLFTQETECSFCEATRMLLEEISGLSKKISFKVYDFVADSEKVKKYGVDKVPATLLLGDKDYGIRFYGAPAGYEFTTLIEDIRDIGKRNAGLGNEVMNELAKIDQPVHMQVLISPT